MAISAGYNARVYISGDSTAMTGEAMSKVVDGGGAPDDVYQITSTTKRLVDPDTAVTLKNNNVAVAAADFEFDWLMGRVRPNVALAGTGFTLDGNYLALNEITRASQWEIDKEIATRDRTVFKAGSYRERMATLKDATISLTRFEVGGTDYDAGASSVRLHDLLTNGTTKIVELNFGSSLARLAVMFDRDTNRSAVEDLVNSTITGRIAAIAPAGATYWTSEGMSMSDFYVNGSGSPF